MHDEGLCTPIIRLIKLGQCLSNEVAIDWLWYSVDRTDSPIRHRSKFLDMNLIGFQKVAM